MKYILPICIILISIQFSVAQSDIPSDETLKRKLDSLTIESITDSTNGKIFANIAEAHFHLSAAVEHTHLNSAIHFYSKAIDLGVQEEKIFFMRAFCYSGLGKYSDANFDILTAIHIDPESVRSISFLGLMEYNQENYGSAIIYLTHALELDPSDITSKRHRGICYHFERQFQNAINDLNISIAKVPNDIQALYYRALSYSELKQWELSDLDYKKIIAIDSTSDWGPGGLAHNQLKQNNYETALPLYKKAVKLYPQEPIYYFELAILFEKQNKPTYVINYLDQYIALEPDVAIAYIMRSIAHRKLGNHPESQRNIAKAALLGLNSLSDGFKSEWGLE